jgi:putative toxin-antitoxin system antitoxin component (TIGR02293 family)
LDPRSVAKARGNHAVAAALAEALQPNVVRVARSPIARYRQELQSGNATAVLSKPASAPTRAPQPKRIAKLAFAQLAAMDGLVRDKAVRGGLPVALLDEAARVIGVSQNALLGALGIPTSTASRRKAGNEPLSVEESDRVARLARLWHDVMTVFQDEEGAKAWINGRVPVLGAVPLQLLATSDGFEQARAAIRRLAYGVYA